MVGASAFQGPSLHDAVDVTRGVVLEFARSNDIVRLGFFPSFTDDHT